MTDVLYRYEDVLVTSALGEYGISQVDVKLREYPILKKTAKGMWIDLCGMGPFKRATLDSGTRRFVLDRSTKQFACKTIQEARKSFVARKCRQISIYKARLGQAERALDVITNLEGADE